MDNTLVSIIAVLGGLFSIIASILNWNWYFENRRARVFVKIFGRNGARIFYVILGVFLCVVGIVTFFVK